MIFLVASVLLQLYCAVHIVRTGRNSLWLMVVIFLSIPGCLAYLLLEVLPGQRNNRAVRAAGQVISRKLDPERELRAARERLEVADTAANHIALGDAFAQAGDHRQAARHFEAASGRQPRPDRATLVKLAGSQLELGEAARALATLDKAPAPGSQTAADQQAFLRARILEGAGQRDEALGIYREVSERLAGEEALCRYAALCLELGNRAEARTALEKVELKARRLTRTERAVNRDMHEWAARTLAELRN